MVQQFPPQTAKAIIYSDSDGQPMADNTKQFRWIVTIKENLEILFANVDDVFVAGNLFWYPVQGHNKIRQAPDAMVIFGRPKGDRTSYKQWEEENVIPQVVFEIISPGNSESEMTKKAIFYQRYGVEEYYIYDPEDIELTGLIRSGNWLEPVDEMNGWVSPRLGIRFEIKEDNLEIYRPDGQKFLTSIELDQLREQERQRAEEERQHAEEERQHAEEERQHAEEERQRAEEERQRADNAIASLEQERLLREQEQQRYQELLQKLRDRNIDPEQL